jgi:V/A-type H+-transporting ATPase subunit K
MALCLTLGVPAAFAADEGDEAHGEEGGGTDGLGVLGLGLGAGLAVGLAGLATGLAQSGVGAGGTGALAEKPELFGNVLILFAIPETIVVFGFVIAFMLLGNI